MTAFLARHGWQDATQVPLAGDASARRYTRLTMDGDRAILVQDPDSASAARFADLAAWLTGIGLSAPRIFAAEPAAGLMLIEDLGDGLIARLSGTPGSERAVYTIAADALAALQRHAPPADLSVQTPAALAQATDLAFTHYTQAPALFTALQAPLAEVIDRHAPPGGVCVLRDYHAENILYLPGRTGAARAGLLDFQDAVIGHPAYDLASLVHDVRRDLFPGTAEAVFTRFAEATGAEDAALRRAAAVLSLQRNLRILGVFARIARSGKPGYLRFLPRVWRHIQTALADPACARLRPVLAAMPAPTPAHIRGLRPDA